MTSLGPHAVPNSRDPPRSEQILCVALPGQTLCSQPLDRANPHKNSRTTISYMCSSTYNLLEMTRLTLHLSPLHVQTIDWLMSGDENYRPDGRHRRLAVEQLILDHASMVRERASQKDAQPTPGRDRGDATLRTIDRLKKSRDRYRELAVRAEAALLGLPVRDDFHGLERRLEQGAWREGIRPARETATESGGPATRPERETTYLTSTRDMAG